MRGTYDRMYLVARTREPDLPASALTERRWGPAAMRRNPEPAHVPLSPGG